MFCTNCGAQLPDEAKFCVTCGTPVEPPLARKPEHRDPADDAEAPVTPPDRAADVTTAHVVPAMRDDRPVEAMPAPPAAEATAHPTTPIPPTASPQAPSAQSPKPPRPAPDLPADAPDDQALPQAPATRSRLPLVIGIAAALVIGLVVFLVTQGGPAPDAPIPNEPTSIEVGELDEAVVSALDDVAELAGEMAARYESYFDESGSNIVGANSGTSFDQASERIDAETTRVRTARATLEAADDFTGRTQAIGALDNLLEILAYEQGVFHMQKDIATNTSESGGTAGMLAIVEALYEGYRSLEAPAFLDEYNSHTVDKLPTIYRALIENLNGPSSTLSQYTSRELLQWWISKQNSYDNESNRSVILQCKASSDLLSSITDGALRSGAPTVSIDAIGRIAPNLYPSLDAATIVDVTAYDERTVTVSAEVVGFTQPFEEQYALAQGYNRLPIKPATLPSNQMGSLASNSDTQLNVKVIDTKTGATLAQKSQPVELLSIYDFIWADDEFGATAAFDILAWLRPQCDEVLATNRQAAEILGEWTNGQHKSIVGYQYGDDWSGTLMQVAAIQKAMSDAGVVYIMDNYSYTSEQHVLTPDQVVQKRQGLCIETSLLLSSCLMSAGMHPMIILSPGHAQVAVETYSGSGLYFLIETTTLPYDGVDPSYAYDTPEFWSGLLADVKTSDGGTHVWTLNGTPEEWQEYFDFIGDGSDEFGGVFVIDCQLQKLMAIQGLETI